MARAALALVSVDAARARDLLAELVARLERAGHTDVVSLSAERAKRRP